MVRFTIITAFPDFFREFLSTSVVGRGVKDGLFEVEVVDLRSFGKGAYRQIDDYAFGSGGMVLMAEPVEEALNSVQGDGKAFVVYPTPQGALLTQEIVESLFHQPHVVIVCGHYEGLDERFIERRVDLEVTIGDCVLTGGEIPAMAVIDAVARLIPGVVGREEAVVEDSFYRGMLDHPHYTRPASWMGMDVPGVLSSGNFAEILDWRRKQAVIRTISRRPDLLSRSSLRGYMRGGFYVSFEYEPEQRHGVERVKELAGLCETYGVMRLLVVVKSPLDRETVRRTLKIDGSRFGKIKLMPSVDRTLDWVKEREKTAKDLTVVDVCDEAREGGVHWLELKRFILENGGPVVFRFLRKGESGLEENVCPVLAMLPLEDGKLSFGGKFTAVLDRFLGSK